MSGQQNRREFLQTTLFAAAAGAGIISSAERASAASGAATGLVDVNVNLSRWPLRDLRWSDPGQLSARLRQQGVTQAWAGTFDGLLHKDIASANARLADDCRRQTRGLCVPFGSINPKAPDWEEELRRCAQEHRMPGVRLHPNYHGYKLDDPMFERLLRLAAGAGLLVQLAVVMEDERMMHPLLRVEPVDLSPLTGLVRAIGGLRLVLLNALRTLRGKPLQDLLAAGEVCVEISMLEGVLGISNLLSQVPVERVLFGSDAPLFYFEAAALKLKESPLSEAQARAIRRENARRLLAKPR